MPRYRTPKIQEIEKICGPSKTWKGRCYEIACAIIEAELCRGRAVHGAWLGEIHPDSYFGGRPFAQHGWIIRPDAVIVDPTRWVFEALPVYIFTGPAAKHPEYDVGKRRLRRALMGDEDPPHPVPGARRVKLKFKEPGHQYVIDIFNTTELSVNQIRWIANRDPDELGEAAASIYQGIIDGGQAGWIPYDNHVEVMGERSWQTAN